MEFKAICISTDEGSFNGNWATSWEIYRCKVIRTNWGSVTTYFGDDGHWHRFDNEILERI